MRKNLLLLLYILAFIQLVLPFFLQDAYYQPHRDVFLYLAEGRHMAWGYMEVPPLLSVFAWLTHALGDSMFWINWWPTLFGALTFLMVGRIVLTLGGKAFALILAWLPFVVDGYLRLFFLFQPNFLEVFFWTAIGFCVLRWIQTSRVYWLYLLGISIGLGMMSKYSVAFYTVSILLGLALSRHRTIPSPGLERRDKRYRTADRPERQRTRYRRSRPGCPAWKRWGSVPPSALSDRIRSPAARPDW